MMTSHSISEPLRRYQYRRPLRATDNHGHGHEQEHPFRERSHEENFPPFELAFARRIDKKKDCKSQVPKENGNLVKENSISYVISNGKENGELNQSEEITKDDNESSDSDGDRDGDDELSIGARAALQDHFRYLARYDMDGHEPKQKSAHCHQYSFNYDIDGDDDNDDDHDYIQDKCEHKKGHSNSDSEIHRGINCEISTRDELWNHLLDNTFASQSSISSFNTNILDKSFNAKINSKIVNIDDDQINHEGVEVSLINSSTCYSDYFNTSKVLLLATPEKIKTHSCQRVPSPSRRNQNTIESQFDITSGNSKNASPKLPYIMPGFQQPHQENSNHTNRLRHRDNDDCLDAEENFINLNDSFAGGVDLSRISAAPSERTPLRGSPIRWQLGFKHDSSTSTTPQSHIEQHLPDASFGSFLSPVMPIATHSTTNLDASALRQRQPPNLVNLPTRCLSSNDNEALSGSTRSFLPRPHPTMGLMSNILFARSPQELSSPPTADVSPIHSHSYWLSPTEVTAAQIADQLGLWTKSKPFPFPNDENDQLSLAEETDKTKTFPITEEELPCVPPARPQHHVHSSQPIPRMAFSVENCSSVASTSGVTSCFGLDANNNHDLEITLSHAFEKKLSVVEGDRQYRQTDVADVSFNVSAIENESDCESVHPLSSDRSSLPLSSSVPVVVISAVMNQNNNSSSLSTTTTATQNPMEDRRRYRTVVPNRVLFDETDDNHYHQYRDDSFSVAASYS